MAHRRLTLVVPALGVGGAEKVMTNMANAWAEKGWEITLLTFSAPDMSPFYPLHPAVNLCFLSILKPSKNIIAGVWNNIRRVLIIRRTVVATLPDTVISFMDRTNVITLIALLFTGIPVIVSERSNPQLSLVGKGWNLLRRVVYPLAYYIIVQTERGRSTFPRRLQDKILVIHNPAHAPSDEITKIMLPRPCIIGVGRIVNEKGFDLLLKAFASISRQFNEWSLILLGDGPLRSELERLANDIGITTRVKFLGFVSNPSALMRQADIFVLSSRIEGFPNTLCEAMACGLPVIATDCPMGPREIIREGVDGLLVPPEDVNALAAAMETLMSNAAIRKLLGKNALDVIDRFHPEKIMQMWEDHLP